MAVRLRAASARSSTASITYRKWGLFPSSCSLIRMTPEPGADAHLDALRLSARRLRDIVTGLSETELTGRAYPAEWTIAQVLSHLGSAAVIMQRRLDETLDGATTPDDFAPTIWDVWNAKTPTQQRDDSLA